MEQVVTVRIPAREVKRRFAELPAVLEGKLPDRHGLRPLFFSLIAKFLFQKIHTAFRLKSMGASDELGNSWRSLSTKTVKRRLQPSVLDRYPQSVRLFMLRVSDTLFDSFAPGSVTAGSYRPVPNQLFRLERNSLSLGSLLRYAKYVHKKRPLWPKVMKAWTAEAVDHALGIVMERLAYIMSREK